MRARTHPLSCNYGIDGIDGPLPCTCGVSPAALTADQLIRMEALRHAVARGSTSGTRDVLREARDFETYIKGEISNG